MDRPPYVFDPSMNISLQLSQSSMTTVCLLAATVLCDVGRLCHRLAAVVRVVVSDLGVVHISISVYRYASCESSLFPTRCKLQIYILLPLDGGPFCTSYISSDYRIFV